jgi:hypothetical protein
MEVFKMKEQLALMVEHGAVPYWYAMAAIPVVVGFQVYCLEVDNKFTRGVKKVVKYLLEDIIDMMK